MEKLTLFHSFWSAPAIANRWGMTGKLIDNVILFSYSLLLAKKTLGCTFNLHTDDIGKELLSFLPYDRITTDLNDIPQSPLFWAAGKFKAFENEPLGAIHIDGDFFIQKKRFAGIIGNDYDLLVQNPEYWVDSKPFSKIVTMLSYHPDNIVFKAKYQYNTGIIQINNAELKEKYLYWYNRLSADLMHTNEFNRLTMADDICFDLILEQANLYTLAQGYSVKTVLNPDETWQHDAKCLGVCHLLGTAKYGYIGKILDKIKGLDENIHKHLIELKNGSSK